MSEDVQGWGTATGEAHTMGTAEGDGGGGRLEAMMCVNFPSQISRNPEKIRSTEGNGNDLQKAKHRLKIMKVAEDQPITSSQEEGRSHGSLQNLHKQGDNRRKYFSVKIKKHKTKTKCPHPCPKSNHTKKPTNSQFSFKHTRRKGKEGGRKRRREERTKLTESEINRNT